jgi:hypothetical protein
MHSPITNIPQQTLLLHSANRDVIIAGSPIIVSFESDTPAMVDFGIIILQAIIYLVGASAVSFQPVLL